MYITLLGKLVEVVLDIGVKGFTLCVYVAEMGIFSIDTSYREIAIFGIALAIIYALKRRKK